MDRKTIVALLLLTIPLLFLEIVALQELAGVAGPIQVLYPEGVGSVRRAMTDVVIVGGRRSWRLRMRRRRYSDFGGA